mgnify:FL=1
MPTIFRHGPYRFHFYSCDGVEPPHVHVARGDCEAKFWLQPVVLARNYGLPSHEIAKIVSLIEEHEEALIAAWEQFHGKR